MSWAPPTVPNPLWIWAWDHDPNVDPPDIETECNLALGRSVRGNTLNDGSDDNVYWGRSFLVLTDTLGGDYPRTREIHGSERWQLRLPTHPWWSDVTYYLQAAEVVGLGFPNQHYVLIASPLDEVL